MKDRIIFALGISIIGTLVLSLFFMAIVWIITGNFIEVFDLFSFKAVQRAMIVLMVVFFISGLGNYDE